MELIQNLSSRFEENVRLLELLQAEKDEKVFLRRTIEEKDYLINDLNKQLRKLESQRISPRGDNRQADWEKPKKAVKNVFPPKSEMPTTNRFNDLDFEDNDIPEDNNAPDDPFEIQLSNVKLKRKIQYLQLEVLSHQLNTTLIISDNLLGLQNNLRKNKIILAAQQEHQIMKNQEHLPRKITKTTNVLTANL